MENSKTKYLLGLMLALVWGLVAYRLYDKYFGKKENMINNTPAIFEEKTKLKQDSFTLLLDYKDPFKYAEIQQEERPVFQSSSYANHYPSVSIEAPKNEIKQMPAIIFPDIAYKGNIKSKSGRIVALVSVDGSISNLAISDVWKEVQLTNIYDDSIKIFYKNTYKTISKIQ
jgi:hypothetical protein